MGELIWRLLTADEAYQLLSYRTPKALREAAQHGLVPCVRIGRLVRFDLVALREWAAGGGTSHMENSKAQTQDKGLAATA